MLKARQRAGLLPQAEPGRLGLFFVERWPLAERQRGSYGEVVERFAVGFEVDVVLVVVRALGMPVGVERHLTGELLVGPCGVQVDETVLRRYHIRMAGLEFQGPVGDGLVRSSRPCQLVPSISALPIHTSLRPPAPGQRPACENSYAVG